MKSKKEKSKFSLIHYRKDERIIELVNNTNKKTLAIWAKNCAERVLAYFEKQFSKDYRPRNALITLQMWIDSGIFKMAVIRKASLDSHAAAREVNEDSAARSAARATGQAVATAHVKTHSIGAAIYALQAIHRATNASDANNAVIEEKEWQYQQLLRLREELASK